MVSSKPDNLVWAADGMIYVQEDNATKINDFSAATGHETSIWRIDPNTPDDYQRIAEIDRSVVLPAGANDSKRKTPGKWESSGIIEVTPLLPAPAQTTLIATVQAHTVRNGGIGGYRKLVQSGQLVWLETANAHHEELR